MTFKDLRRWLSNNDIINNNSNNNQAIKLNSERFAIFRNKPFWIENVEIHKEIDRRTERNCCFNHIIGLPKKDGDEKKIFDYEMDLVNVLNANKSVWIKKSRGLGITELILRYMAWLCVYDETYQNTRMHIITGPRVNLAEELIDRLHNLFLNSKLEINCKQAGPIIYVNNVTIEAFPSHTSFSMRGFTDVKFIFADESAFFPPGQQEEVKHTIEGYRIKTDPHIVIVSTPNKPGDYFESIDKDQNSIFKKVYLPYTVGLDKIYDPIEIEKEKSKSYFKREYEGFYSFGTGNIFLQEKLEIAEQLGIKYRERNTPYTTGAQTALGVDSGFGSSATAFTVIQLVDNIIHVVYSKKFDNSSTEKMVYHTVDLIHKYDLMNESNRVFFDASAPGFIRSCKYQVGEDAEYERIIDKARLDGRADQLHLYMNLVPIPFSTKGKPMLENVKKFVDLGKLAIDPQEHGELLSDMRMATANEEMLLEKTRKHV